MPDERALVEAAKGDPNRFSELYEIHFDRVYAYVARRVRDRHEAEDLTSEVFHKALANIRQFEWRGAPFAAWLFRIAANAIADHVHRIAKEQSFADGDESREAGIEQARRTAEIFGLLSSLPEDQRRVLEMRFVEERSIREIAAVLGRSEGAIKQLQFRGLQNLRSLVGEQNG